MARENQETQMEDSWRSCALQSVVFIEIVKNECDMSGHDKAMIKPVFSQENKNHACSLHKISVIIYSVLAVMSCV